MSAHEKTAFVSVYPEGSGAKNAAFNIPYFQKSVGDHIADCKRQHRIHQPTIPMMEPMPSLRLIPPAQAPARRCWWLIHGWEVVQEQSEIWNVTLPDTTCLTGVGSIVAARDDFAGYNPLSS